MNKQMDLYEADRFYYDLEKDPAKLGTWRDFLKAGDKFQWDKENFVIEEVRASDQTWLVVKERDV